MDNRIINIATKIDATNTTQIIPLFQSVLTENTIPYGYILELNASIDVQSVAEYQPPTIPSDVTAQDAINNLYYLSAKTNPGKILEIWLGDNNGGLISRQASILCWNRRPYYPENIASYLVKTATNFVIEPGKGLYAKIVQWNSNGVLSGADRIDFSGMVFTSNAPI
jgi:hypothetical protein